MAIAFDSSSFKRTSTSSDTLSHTCSGTDRILIVGIMHFSGADRISSLTYDGVSLTNIAGLAFDSSALYLSLWYLINPSTGANNISMTLTGTYTSRIMATSYTGAKQSGQPDASATTTIAASSITGTVTTVADNAWTLMTSANGSGIAWTAGAGTTLRSGGATSDNCAIFDSNSAKTPAGSSSLIGNTSSGPLAAVTMSIAPAPDTTNSGFFRLMM